MRVWFAFHGPQGSGTRLLFAGVKHLFSGHYADTRVVVGGGHGPDKYVNNAHRANARTESRGRTPFAAYWGGLKGTAIGRGGGASVGPVRDTGHTMQCTVDEGAASFAAAWG